MTFRMEAWSSSEKAWRAMDAGPAKSAWKPRKTAAEAVQHCIEWTGRPSIPAMRVRDLSSDTIVWQATEHYPELGEPIALAEETLW